MNRHVITFFLMISMAVLLILVVGNVRPKPISSVIAKEKFWVEKVHSEKKYEVILAGDSRMYRAADPKTISASLDGRDVLNFGFSSGGFNPVMFEQIQNKLSNSDDKIIVLGITPYSLTPKAQENSHFLQEYERESQDVFNKRYLNPTLDFFDPIKPEELINYLKTNRDSIEGYHEDFKEDGWVSSYRLPARPEAALPKYIENFKGNKVDQQVVKALISQIEDWVSQDILVFALRMPSTEAMEQLENEVSGFEEEAIKRQIEKAGAIWWQQEQINYLSYDGSHLHTKAAIEFSRNLGLALKKEASQQ